METALSLSEIEQQRFDKVKQILSESCLSCHGSGGSAVFFDFSTTEEFISSGLISPGKPLESKLIYRLQNFTESESGTNNMPLGSGPIEDADYQLLYSWVLDMSVGSSPFLCENDQFDPASMHLQEAKRLSVRQYENTLKDILSLAIGENEAHSLVESVLENNPLPIDTGEPFVRSNNSYTGQHGRAYFNIANELAIAMSSSYRTSIVSQFIALNPGSCRNPNPSNMSMVCKNQWIRNFAGRAFRRPLREANMNLTDSEGLIVDELSSLLSEFDSTSTQEGLNRIIFRVLMAPHFLFHIEDQNLLEPSENPNIYRLSSFAIANRLSYRLWNSPPDNELWEMAQSSNLYEEGPFNQALNYVLSHSEKIEDSLREYFNNWLHLEAIPQFAPNSKFALIEPNISFDSDLRRSMIQEIEELGAYTVRSGGSFEQLFTSDISFARDPDLLQLYDLSQAAPWAVTPANATRFPASQRGGILTRAGMLISGSELTNPILRGVHLRKDILCLDLGAPPANALDEFDSIEVPHVLSTREKVDIKTSGSSCVGCHALINPLGFGFSHYDAFGRFIDQEAIFHPTRNEIDAFVDVNAEVDLSAVLGPGAEAANAVELSQMVSEQQTTRACFAKKFLSFAQNRPVDESTEGCRLDKVYGNLEANSRLIDMVRSSVLGPEFRLRKIQND